MTTSSVNLSQIEHDLRDALSRRAAASEGDAHLACVDFNELAADIDPMMSDRELDSALRHLDAFEVTQSRPPLSGLVIDGQTGSPWQGPAGGTHNADHWESSLQAAVGYWRQQGVQAASAGRSAS